MPDMLGGAKHLFWIGRLNCADACLPPLQSTVFSLQSSAGFTTGRANVRLPPSGSTDKENLLITPHPRGAQSALLSGGSTALTLVCRLPASSPTGTFKRCRRRISGTYRTYGTYRTKVDRMANSFSADLLWCGSRPPVQRMKKILLITPHPQGAKHLFWIGRLSLTRAACILALSERQRS